MSLLLLSLFLIGGSVAALALSTKNASIGGIAVIAVSVALSAALFFGIASGLSEFPRGVVMLFGGIVSIVILLMGCALGLGALEVSTAETRGPVWDILVGALVLGMHIFLGHHFLKGPYGLTHLLWDAFGVLALSRGIYRLRPIRKVAKMPSDDA